MFMKKIMSYTAIACLCWLCGSVLFVSCEDNDFETGGDDPDPTEGVEVNRWIGKIMLKEYLWADEIPREPDYNLDPERFFYSLLSLKDGKENILGNHYYYSRIEANKEYTDTRTSIDPDDTYGMEFVTYNMVDDAGKPLGYYWSRILYILPDSPAEKAGLKRGDWLTRINGTRIYKDNYLQLLRGPEIELTVMKDKTKPDVTEELKISSSLPVEDNPLHYHTTLSVGGKKVGYLLYNHFTTGPKGFEDSTYDQEMKQILTGFANQNVDEFVLDLRYNGGGYLRSATLLASSLVSEDHKDDVFGIETDNKGKEYRIKFSAEGETPHLKLNRLFVLTSESTASASEAVINGLIPYYGKDNIILIGDKTEGKNVGSVRYSDNKYEWAIQPIVMRITNKEGASNDYSAGLLPDYKRDELDVLNMDLLPFGDPGEYMLGFALSLIKGAAPFSRVVRPEAKENIPVYQSIDRYRTNGVVVHPEQWAKRNAEK